MKKLLMLLLLPLLVISCTGQIEKKSQINDSSSQDKLTKPKTDIRVNKEYDDEGNLIRYDSTYFWSYSNIQGDSVFVDIDSVMSKFHPFLNARQRFRYPGFGNYLFLNDSLFYNDFLYNDYFMNRWENNMFRMNQMMYEMDSLKSLFFDKNYPELIQHNSNTD